MEFYNPIISWLREYTVWLDEKQEADQMELNCAFNLNYYNSGSVRFLILILQQVKNMKEKVKNVTVEWFYEHDDIQLLENGQELEQLLGLSFTFIATQ